VLLQGAFFLVGLSVSGVREGSSGSPNNYNSSPSNFAQTFSLVYDTQAEQENVPLTDTAL
jgi:hypothetical protein